MSNWVAVLALILAYVAIVAAYFALRTLAKVRRATNVLARGTRGPEGSASLLEATQHNADQLVLLGEELAALRMSVGEVREVAAAAVLQPATPVNTGNSTAAPGGLRNVALVRYDAFGEMSGRMSFSLALLDEHGDGVTISAIAGRADTRVYAKGVAGGKGEHDLSPEEQQAVAAALAKRRPMLARKRSA